jgi:hypothetical protein
VLPSWFAEYGLDLTIVALILSCALAAYGWMVAITGRFAGMLRDVSRSRRPAGIVAITTPVTLIVIVGLASIPSTSHLRVATLAVVSAALITGLVCAAMYPFRRLWTNAYWRIPPSTAITTLHLQAFGRIYVVFAVAFIVADAGGLIGLIPKLIYVGSGLIPAIFAIAEIAALIIAAVVAVKGWRLFQMVQVRPNNADSHA